MAKVKIILDNIGETLTVYFKEPATHQICKELDDGMILIKDEKTKEVLGFEKLHYKTNKDEALILESHTIGQKAN